MRYVRTDAKIGMARRLRKSMTKPEVWLWLRLRARIADGLVFRNQHPLGPYVLDFYCPKAKLCVEVDGQEHTRDAQIAKDTKRDAWLAEQGIMVHRIAATGLLANPDETADAVIDVAEKRFQSLRSSTEEPRPPPDGGPPSP